MIYILNIFRIKLFLLFIVTFALYGCVTTGDELEKEYVKIIDANVILENNIVTGKDFDTKFRNALLNYVNELNQNNNYTESILSVKILEIHYKHPIVSMVFGDANHVKAAVEIVDANTGATIRKFEVYYADLGSAAINGAIGAVLSVLVPKETVDKTLISGMTKRIVREVYQIKSIPADVSANLKERDIFLPAPEPEPILNEPESPDDSNNQSDIVGSVAPES
jgi:hypothetical protein